MVVAVDDPRHKHVALDVDLFAGGKGIHRVTAYPCDPVALHEDVYPRRELLTFAVKDSDILEECVGCARCDSACPNDFSLHSFMIRAGEERLWEQKYKMRVGRGAISDVEIREVGSPIVFGEIPGVVAIVGCSNYPHGEKELAEIAEEFAKLTENDLSISENIVELTEEQYFVNDNLASLSDLRVKSNGMMEQ